MTPHDAFWHWFAGFLDGEGCFAIQVAAVYIIIRLRADDAEVLKHIQANVGGTIGTTDGGKTAWWRSSSRAPALVELVRELDTHPLRAKKQRDYAVWRQAALERSGACSRARIAELGAELKAVRGAPWSI